MRSSSIPSAILSVAARIGGHLLLLLFFPGSLEVWSQSPAKDPKAIASLLYAQQSDSALFGTLDAEGLLDGIMQDGPGNLEGASAWFDHDKLEIEEVEKNLMGDATPETILVIRSEQNFLILVFHLQDGTLRRVPGGIGHIASTEISYYDQEFRYEFLEIAAPDQYCFFTHTDWGYNRSSTTVATVWQVTPEGFRKVYSFEESASTYSGLLTYNYGTERTAELNESHKFPRSLILTQHTENEENSKMDDEGNALSGTITTISGKINVFFSLKKGHLTLAKEVPDLHESVEHFGSEDEK